MPPYEYISVGGDYLRLAISFLSPSLLVKERPCTELVWLVIHLVMNILVSLEIKID